MKNNHKFPSFWLNYKTIVSVERFAGFATDENGQINVRQPIWRRLRKSQIDNLGQNDKLFCRLEMIEGNAETLGYGDADIFDLPIYNKYFFLGNDDATLLTPQMVAQRIAQELFGNEEQNEEQN